MKVFRNFLVLVTMLVSCGPADSGTSHLTSSARWAAGCYVEGNEATGYISISNGLLSGSVRGSHRFQFCNGNGSCSGWSRHSAIKTVVGSGIKEITTVTARPGTRYCTFVPDQVDLR